MKGEAKQIKCVKSLSAQMFVNLVFDISYFKVKICAEFAVILHCSFRHTEITQWNARSRL